MKHRYGKPNDRSLTLERLKGIFGHPEPPKTVTERQFDYAQEKLVELAGTSLEQMNLVELQRYYYDDLRYVELQPELFDYLFPACLWDWHLSLQASEDRTDFHDALLERRLFDVMLTAWQRQQVFLFLQDSALERLHQERGLITQELTQAPYRWLQRWNTLGCCCRMSAVSGWNGNDSDPLVTPWPRCNTSRCLCISATSILCGDT